MSNKLATVQAMELNANLIGALFTDQVDEEIRVFCIYVNGSTSEFQVPSESNRTSLHHLFARLDMIDKCTSVIMEKIVQGRLYVEQAGKLVSYTLVSQSGLTPLPITPDLITLPWKRVWASPEAEVLELPPRREHGRYLAIRSPVSDIEATSIYRSSNAFISPMATPHHAANYFIRVGIAAGIALLLFGTVWSVKHFAGRPAETVVRAKAVVPSKPMPQIHAHMLHDQQITGPFTTRELLIMSAEGKFDDDALFRLEGSTEWVKLNQLLPSATISPVVR
jgi:hypothetical protein